LFRAGNFAEALRAYGDAHREFPSPKLLFNIALCEESLGHRPEALENLHAFVRRAPDADPQFRAEAKRRMSDLTAALAAVDVSALPANAAVAVDGRTVGLTPLDRPVWIEPGAHRVSIERAGRPLWVITVEGSAGATVALRVPDTALAEPPGPEVTEPRPAPEPRKSRWWIWVGAGLVLAGAATLLIVIKLNECPATQCQ
jgi:tetratricopeptide (TPR) repeat protein